MYFDVEAFMYAALIAGSYATLVTVFKRHFWSITTVYFILVMLWFLLVTAFIMTNDLIAKTFVLF
mgnify:CR=1 FL=1